MSEFFVGQKVICIDTGNNGGVWIGDAPTVGATYTITQMVGTEDGVWLLFAEIERCALAKRQHGQGVGYFDWRFRPLETKAIEIFRRIARDVTEDKKVRIDA